MHILVRIAINKTSNVILGFSLGHNKALEHGLPRKETILEVTSYQSRVNAHDLRAEKQIFL